MEDMIPKVMEGDMIDTDLLRILVTPPDRLSGWKRLPVQTLTADSEGRVLLTLPDDFLMLLSLRLSNWERPVTEVLRADHWLRRLQSSRWPALRGTPERPLAFFTLDTACRPALELFSCSPGSTVQLAEFIYHPDSTG